MKALTVLWLVLVSGLLLGLGVVEPSQSMSEETHCSPRAVPVWDLGCYTWWAEPNKAEKCQEDPEECCGTTLEEQCQKCICSDGTVIVDSKITGVTCEDLCYYYDHQIEMPVIDQ